MTDERAEILTRIRRTLGRADESSAHAAEPEAPRDAPAPGDDDAADTVAQFVARLERASGSVTRLDAREQIPRAVLDFLSAASLPPQLARSDPPVLTGLDWPAALEIRPAAQVAEVPTALAAAFAAVAETGSLVMLSGPNSPTAMNFLPETFLCVVRTNTIVPRLEDVWDLVRRDGGAMPRALNLITGPSRTADVEQTLQLGAHGPRRLHVLLLD